MGIPFKAILDVGEKLLSAVRRGSKDEKRTMFEHGKQQFFLEFVTQSRNPNVCRLGYRPTPGKTDFEYCESLFRDGFLDREIVTGRYFIRSTQSELDAQVHHPC